MVANLGHGGVLTTFTSYGAVPAHRQVRLVRSRPAGLEGLDDRSVMAFLSKRLGATD